MTGLANIEWQPIETAPRDGSTVLLAQGDCVDCGFWHDGSECHGHRGGAGWFTEDDRSNLLIASNFHATHWMPFPPPPEKQEPERSKTPLLDQIRRLRRSGQPGGA